MKHTETISPVAAALTALTTLACCLPVGLAAAAATAGMAAVIASYRAWFLGASVVLLTLGFVQLVRSPRACATRRAPVVILALSSAVVALVIFFPQVVAGLLADWMP